MTVAPRSRDVFASGLPAERFPGRLWVFEEVEHSDNLVSDDREWDPRSGTRAKSGMAAPCGMSLITSNSAGKCRPPVRSKVVCAARNAAGN